MIAREFKGALGLPISGRSPKMPSLLRSEPFPTENGVPDWKVVMPAICHPPKGYFDQPDRGPGTDHRYETVRRCGRSKSLKPRSSFNPPNMIGTEVRFMRSGCWKF